MTVDPVGVTRVAPDDLRDYAARILSGLGATESDAVRVADALVSSNVVGHDSHGVLLLPYYEELISRGDIEVGATPEIVVDSGSIAVLEGHRAFGQVVAMAAVKLGIERARRHGVAVVAGRNASHLGRLGEYTEAVADAGLVGILLVNFQGGDQRVTPHGAREARLTNNPISLGVPGVPDTMVLDMALSVVAEAKVWLAKARGVPLPDGAILDSEGEPTNDPDDFLHGGSLLPLGGLGSGYKGYGLIVLIDAIVGALSGGGMCSGSDRRFSNAFVLFTIDSTVAQDESEYRRELAALAAHVKSARRLPTVAEILLPGDPERQAAQTRTANGVPLEETTRSVLADLARRVGVDAI